MTDVVTVTMDWVNERCEEDGDCLIWKLRVSGTNQPVYCFRVDGKHYGRHVRRLVWTASGGRELRPKEVVTPSCGNSKCLNPEHLGVSTKAKILRKSMDRPDVRAAYSATGAKRMRPEAKLTMEKAAQIRASDKKPKELAEEFGVCTAMVSKIRRGVAWRDLSNPFAGLFG